MWGLLAQVAGTMYSQYQQYKAAQEKQKAFNQRLTVNKTLAAEQLAVTYNSIMMKSMEVSAEFARKEFQIRAKERQAMGKATAQAGAAGAAGRRVELARQMAIAGGAERMMTEVEVDAKRAQDAMISRADMEERAMINRLISMTPDAPAEWDADASMASGLLRIWSSYNEYTDRKEILKELTVSGK